MTKIILAVVAVLVLLGVGAYFWLPAGFIATTNPPPTTTPDPTTPPAATSTPHGGKVVIGKSVEGRDIELYQYGQGTTELLFVGGIHGGYEWNTTLVAHNLMDYLAANPEAIPSNIKVTVIPTLNPDGLYSVVGTAERFSPTDVPSSQTTVIAGRFNANKVDLNRNFDCDWQASATWQSKTVSGGTQAFSEPESQAIKAYIESNTPEAVVVWYSAGGGVFASSCHNGVLDETKTITNLYAKAAGYKASNDFDFYSITGDMVNWLAKKEIPAISVLLTTHSSIEWDKNLSGITALFKHYAQ